MHGQELHAELKHGGSLEHGVDEDDEEAGPGGCWQPSVRGLRGGGGGSGSVQGAGVSQSQGGKDKDILAILVSIYGSTDVFIVEYRSLLAEKLLQNSAYSSDMEMAIIELLKLRCEEGGRC